MIDPMRDLYVLLLDALKEFPGIYQVQLFWRVNHIEITFRQGQRGVSRVFAPMTVEGMNRDMALDLLVLLIGKMVETIKPQPPGPGAAWGSRKET